MLKLVCAVWLNKLRAIVNEWKVYKKLRTRNIITMWWSVRLDSFVDVAVGWMRVCVCVYSFFPLLSCFLASLVFVFHSVWIQFIPFWLSSNRARNSHCYAVCMVCYNARFIWLNGIKCKTHKWIPSVDLWALLFLSDCAVVVVMPSYWWIEMTKWQILRHIYVWCATRSLTEVQLFGEVHVSLCRRHRHRCCCDCYCYSRIATWFIPFYIILYFYGHLFVLVSLRYLIHQTINNFMFWICRHNTRARTCTDTQSEY